jgi:hypothetical protein
MAKLTSPFCQRCVEISTLIAEGHGAEAKKLAAAHLRGGAPLPQCLSLAADLLDPPIKRTRKDGRPRQGAPRRFVEINARFEELREFSKHDAAINQTAEYFGCSPSTVENARRAVQKFK